MFHQGDLQSGISLAIQQAKLVVCFVRDSSDESREWEDEWLRDEQLATPLVEKAVSLRLEAGSQEAGFLSAFCPIVRTPALVVIHNGQLRLCLVGGIGREDFMQRLHAVLDPDAAPRAQEARNTSQEPDRSPLENPGAVAEEPLGAEGMQEELPERQPAAEPSQAIEEPPPPAVNELTAAPSSEIYTTHTPEAQMPPPIETPPVEPSAPAQPPPPAAPTTEPASSSSSTEPSATPVQNLLSNRAARLEAERLRAQEAETAARAAKAAGKRKAVEAETAASSSRDPKQLSYAAQERVRKQSRRDELNRILERVEADKRARKEREEMRRAQREAELQEIAGAGGGDATAAAATAAQAQEKAAAATSGSRGPASKTGDVCLRIRLLDGSQIREYFPPAATLAEDVRPRVDWALGADTGGKPPPYSFKHLLAPLPNRNLGAAEEAKPLTDLPDVVPSATLVLVPVRGAVEAYSGAGGGILGKVFVAMLGMWNLLSAILATIFAPFARAGGAAGGRTASDGSEGAAGDGAGGAKSSGRGDGSEASGSGIRIRTLRDRRDQGNEYYNGNSLDFEPKEKEEEEEEEEDGKEK